MDIFGETTPLTRDLATFRIPIRYSGVMSGSPAAALDNCRTAGILRHVVARRRPRQPRAPLATSTEIGPLPRLTLTRERGRISFCRQRPVSCASADVTTGTAESSGATPSLFCRQAPYQLTCAPGAAVATTPTARPGEVSSWLHHFLTSLILAQDQRWRRA